MEAPFLPSVLPSFLPSLLPPRCLFRSAPVDPAGLIRSQPGPGRSANPGFRDAAAGRKHRRRTGMHRDGRRTAAWPLQQRESRDRLNTPPLPAPPPRLPPLLRGSVRALIVAHEMKRPLPPSFCAWGGRERQLGPAAAGPALPSPARPGPARPGPAHPPLSAKPSEPFIQI
ncbi:formin-like protein 14 [Acanthopagrus latus]|uniref:formin-like protein 14 n=1 Tax=Acanthopagrus latus TaxID=8177 RepID=UPI00187C6AAB|nr:formin-like protein 14 [Acanthopagrus latus]